MIGRASIAAAALLAAQAAGLAQQATFSARVDVVRVDALVTDQGRPIAGLGPADFQVFDNGVAQTVDLVSFDQIPLNVVLALDMSDSVAGERLDHLRAAGAALLPALRPHDQAALITFSEAVSLGSALRADVGPIRAALEEATGFGETALVDGAYAGMVVGESDAGRALLLVFSDGVDTASWLASDAVLDAAKRSDVVAYGVSLRSRAKNDFLRDLTSATGGRLLEVEKTANLDAAFLAILDEFRHRYLLSYTPRGVSKEGWHRLEVRVKRRDAAVKARPGYLAGP